MESIHFSDYYIAYFDVLGYRAIFKEDSNLALKLMQKIQQTVDFMHHCAQLMNESFSLLSRKYNFEVFFEVKCFSDNFVICVKKSDVKGDEMKLIMLITMLNIIQRELLIQSNVLVRGAVTKGPLYVSKEFIGGQALIDVVELEEHEFFPRIVIGQSILDDLNFEKDDSIFKKFPFLHDALVEWKKHALFQGEDKSLFLNYLYVFYPMTFFPKETWSNEFFEDEKNLEVVKKSGLQDSRYDEKYLAKQLAFVVLHKQRVCEKVVRYCNYDNVDKGAVDRQRRIIKKYCWIISYHNLFCREVGLNEFLITPISKFNESILDWELFLDGET